MSEPDLEEGIGQTREVPLREYSGSGGTERGRQSISFCVARTGEGERQERGGHRF